MDEMGLEKIATRAHKALAQVEVGSYAGDRLFLDPIKFASLGGFGCGNDRLAYACGIGGSGQRSGQRAKGRYEIGGLRDIVCSAGSAFVIDDENARGITTGARDE